MDINATLNIPPDDVELMRDMLHEIQKLREALLEDVILTEEEAAKLLKVSLSTLRTWRKNGWVPFFSEGKLIKYEREALLKAYKVHFGRVTHYEVLRGIEHGLKRRS